MIPIKCPRCNNDSFTFIVSNMHNKCLCRSCNSFVKFVSFSEMNFLIQNQSKISTNNLF